MSRPDTIIERRATITTTRNGKKLSAEQHDKLINNKRVEQKSKFWVESDGKRRQIDKTKYLKYFEKIKSLVNS